MKVKIEGINELEKLLKKIESSLREETMEKALLAAAEPIRAAASEKAPHRTGKLKENIISEINEKEKMTVDVGPNRDGFYGQFIEFGTSKMSAKPFLRPAFDGKKGTAQKIFETTIRALVEGVK